MDIRCCVIIEDKNEPYQRHPLQGKAVFRIDNGQKCWIRIRIEANADPQHWILELLHPNPHWQHRSRSVAVLMTLAIKLLYTNPDPLIPFLPFENVIVLWNGKKFPAYVKWYLFIFLRQKNCKVKSKKNVKNLAFSVMASLYLL